MQVYRPDKELTETFKQIWIEAKAKNIALDAESMSNEIIGSVAFGYVLYDNGVFDVVQNIDRDFFAENYVAILDSMRRAGIYDTYTYLIKQVLGEQTVIKYSSPRPRHLIINASDLGREYKKLVSTPDTNWITESINGFGLLTSEPISIFTISQLNTVLKILANPAGTYLEVFFDMDSPLSSSTAHMVSVGEMDLYNAEGYGVNTNLNVGDANPKILPFFSKQANIENVEFINDLETGEHKAKIEIIDPKKSSSEKINIKITIDGKYYLSGSFDNDETVNKWKSDLVPGSDASYTMKDIFEYIKGNKGNGLDTKIELSGVKSWQPTTSNSK